MQTLSAQLKSSDLKKLYAVLSKTGLPIIFLFQNIRWFYRQKKLYRNLLKTRLLKGPEEKFRGQAKLLSGTISTSHSLAAKLKSSDIKTSAITSRDIGDIF
jgi:hypothetical protein